MTTLATQFNLTPISDSGQERNAAPETDCGTIKAISDYICELSAFQELTARLGARRKVVGRKGFGVQTMFSLFLARYLLGERYIVRFIRRLEMTPRLREICGLTDGRIPSEATFSRVFKQLSEEIELLEAAHTEVVELLREYLPDIGQRVAIDSTDIRAWSKPFRKPEPSDLDARTGVRTAKNKSVGDDRKSKKTEYFFGFKIHLICCSITGVPLSWVFLPADKNDSPQLPVVLDKALNAYPWLSPTHLMADRGYDSEKNHVACIERSIVPIIHIRRPGSQALKKDRYQGIYDLLGRPSCPDSDVTAMEYVGTERGKDGTIDHLYRCNPEGCPLKAKSSGALTYCDTREIHRERVGGDAGYRLVGPVARSSPEWQSLYAERPVVERLFASLKTSRILDLHQFRGKAKVETHILLALLCYTATMLGKARSGEFDEIRYMRVKLG